MSEHEAARDALQRLLNAMLDEDRGRDPQGQAYADLHDHVLDAAKAAGILIDLKTTPEPVRKVWNVVGTIHMSGGFDVVVKARDEDEARRMVRDDLEGSDVGVLFANWGVELQEVCIQSAEEQETL